mgnify:CR=1 FL=1
MLRKILVPIIAIFLCVGLFSCYGHKEVSLSNDVFLSHKIWKENYDKYVYLVHDDSSVYSLKDVSIVQDSATGDVKTIIGTAANYVRDTLTTKSKREVKKEMRKEVHLFLTENDDREIEDGSGLEINQKDIQKVRMHGRKHKGLLAVLLGIVGAIVALFLLVFVLLIAVLLGGGSDGSDSNSEPTCYVATMVYGSTEAPEVLALRRFRDRYLKQTKLGKAFIKWYYANSPGFVARHQHNAFLNDSIRTALNIFVKLLK